MQRQEARHGWAPLSVTFYWSVSATLPRLEQFVETMCFTESVRGALDSVGGGGQNSRNLRTNPLAAINCVAVAIGRFSSLTEMLTYALDKVLDVVQTEAGCVYLLDEEGKELSLAVHRGLPATLLHDISQMRLGEGLSGRVALTAEPIVIRNLKDDPRLIHQTARDEGLRGFASVPLRSNFKTYGTLNIHTHADRVFCEEDVQLLTSMAAQVGLAVANTRLYMNLQTSERKFRNLVESAADLIYATDRHGCIVYANPALDRLLGHDAATVHERSLTVWSLVHPADRDRVEPLLETMLNGGVHGALEFRMIHRDGGRFRWFSQTSVSLRDESGTVTGMQCLAHDVTERREMQAQIAAAERLADLGRMAAGMAHEIRNPLGAIVNSINAMRQPRVARDPRLFDIICQEGKRLDSIINDFLMFARPSMCRPVPCDLGDLIETCAVLFRRSGRLADSVALRVRCSGDLPPVSVDPNQLRQVLWNLVSNAADATGGSGTVDVEAARTADRDGVTITVTDDGPGITNVAQIFEPFYTTKSQGTGLGLAVASRIVQNHGGILRADNVAGRGARLAFTVAAVPAQPAVETA
jgi:two-component system, sporulation sensor kinase E